MNKVAGYRKMLGKTQSEMAKIFNISTQSYWQKENGKIQFSDEEKLLFKGLVKTIFPDITIDTIFFS
ncbi:transcriptional regulator [Enterococcus sp. JM4C]|uniref:helix-turn-helix transcriptional regulator n=1 Tax=Candidatus Enterococcus huntleyi TaxID=1857217 RepID=UPI00137A609C|nr:transcriptional regulator [Enterococcus sp. JM4C]KAF1295093.1 transcriptional regulator [Enterococcus sp. JM4C]